jgi:hypothetical protein
MSNSPCNDLDTSAPDTGQADRARPKNMCRKLQSSDGKPTESNQYFQLPGKIFLCKARKIAMVMKNLIDYTGFPDLP